MKRRKSTSLQFEARKIYIRYSSVRAVAETGAEGACSFYRSDAASWETIRRQAFAGCCLTKTSLIAIEAFPQKDDPHNRVFPEAKLSTAVFVCCAKPSKERFKVRTHPGRWIREGLPDAARITGRNSKVRSEKCRPIQVAPNVIGMSHLRF